MMVYSTAQAAVCRTAEVPACETCVASGTDIPALATFNMKLRDKLDFAVDFTAWLVANGGASLTSATFAVSGDSPKTPTISGQAFGAAGKAVVVITPANGAVVGDAYYLDVTAQVAATVAATANDVAIPARTLVRRINVVVAAG